MSRLIKLGTTREEVLSSLLASAMAEQGWSDPVDGREGKAPDFFTKEGANIVVHYFNSPAAVNGAAERFFSNYIEALSPDLVLGVALYALGIGCWSCAFWLGQYPLVGHAECPRHGHPFRYSVVCEHWA